MTVSSEEHNRIAAHLKTSPLFSGLELSAVQSLSSLCRVEKVPKGRAIVEEGSLMGPLSLTIGRTFAGAKGWRL